MRALETQHKCGRHPGDHRAIEAVPAIEHMPPFEIAKPAVRTAAFLVPTALLNSSLAAGSEPPCTSFGNSRWQRTQTAARPSLMKPDAQDRIRVKRTSAAAAEEARVSSAADI